MGEDEATGGYKRRNKAQGSDKYLMGRKRKGKVSQGRIASQETKAT